MALPFLAGKGDESYQLVLQLLYFPLMDNHYHMHRKVDLQNSKKRLVGIHLLRLEVAGELYRLGHIFSMAQ